MVKGASASTFDSEARLHKEKLGDAFVPMMVM